VASRLDRGHLALAIGLTGIALFFIPGVLTLLRLISASECLVFSGAGLVLLCAALIRN
jgi:hypothetical protein